MFSPSSSFFYKVVIIKGIQYAYYHKESLIGQFGWAVILSMWGKTQEYCLN